MVFFVLLKFQRTKADKVCPMIKRQALELCKTRWKVKKD